jgi:hypothetical protein
MLLPSILLSNWTGKKYYLLYGQDLPITHYPSLVKILASCGGPFQICSRIFLFPFSPFFETHSTVYGPRVQGGICTYIAFTSFVVFSLPNINLGDRLSEDRMMNISTMARGAFTSRLRDPEKGKYTTTYWQLKRSTAFCVTSCPTKIVHMWSSTNSTKKFVL